MAWLRRRISIAPLVITSLGGTDVRLAVEREMRTRGWRAASSAAQANLLVIAGEPTEPYVQRVWQSMPLPRMRIDLSRAEDVSSVFDAAAAELRTRAPAEYTEVDDTDPAPEDHHQHAGQPENHHEMHGTESTSAEQTTGHTDEHELMDHGAHHDSSVPTPSSAPSEPSHEHHGHSPAPTESAHDQHAHHGHDMGSMEMPGGIPMADRADDRDGLKLDVLTLPLGPATPDWPTGLLVHTVVQGDVIQRAEVEVLSASSPVGQFWLRSDSSLIPGAVSARLVARRLDSCARLFAVAGWEDMSAVARRIRDDLLAGPSFEQTAPELRRWIERGRRSRVLRWTLAGVGVVARDTDVPARLSGDCLDRLRATLDEIDRVAASLDAGPAADDIRQSAAAEARWTLAALPHLLAGAEFAQARLIVASLDPDLEALTREHAHHG